MISIDVRITGDEILTRLDTIPNKVHEKVAEKFGPILEALRAKAVEGIAAKFGKSYPEMFVANVETQGALMIGSVEFVPSDKDYWIRVGSKGILANRETGFISKHDVLHPAMKAESISKPFEMTINDYGPGIVESLEDAIFEAIYEA